MRPSPDFQDQRPSQGSSRITFTENLSETKCKARITYISANCPSNIKAREKQFSTYKIWSVLSP